MAPRNKTTAKAAAGRKPNEVTTGTGAPNLAQSMDIKTGEVAMIESTGSKTNHTAVKRMRMTYSVDASRVRTFRKYVDGEHGLVLTQDQNRILEGLLGSQFCDNICHQIIAEGADRLTFQGWTSENEAVQTRLADLYTTANLEDRSNEVHYDTLCDSNHMVGLWPNVATNGVDLFRKKWWDGTEGVFIVYNAADTPLYVVDDWLEYTEEGAQYIRRNVYYDAYFERWISTDGGQSFQTFIDPADVLEDGTKQWPVPWLKLDGTPLHIPFVHFPNSTRGSGNYGRSELTGGVLGFQDQINDLQYVLSGAARLNGYQIIWATGIQIKADPSKPNDPRAAVVQGNIVVGPGGLLWSPSPDSAFGRIEPGDPTGIVSTYELKLKAVSRMTRTPLHAITGGDWPSGEALLRAEQPAVGKANRQVKKFKTCWATVGHRAIEILNRFSTGSKLPEDVETAPITAMFAPTERRDPLSQSVMIANLAPFISIREALRIAGYKKTEIDQIMDERKTESQDAAEAQAALFSKGIGTGYPGKGPQDTQPGTGNNGGGNNGGGNQPPTAQNKGGSANAGNNAK